MSMRKKGEKIPCGKKKEREREREGIVYNLAPRLVHVVISFAQSSKWRRKQIFERVNNNDVKKETAKQEKSKRINIEKKLDDEDDGNQKEGNATAESDGELGGDHQGTGCFCIQ
jgi:hypothetical protein